MMIATFFKIACHYIIILSPIVLMTAPAWGEEAITPVADSPALQITAAGVRRVAELDLIVFEVTVAGTAGAVVPKDKGKMDGAPVLGYVFPTTLAATDVGFGATDGIVALAVTAHPDFDDTPLWDENNDKDYANDGVIWHTHWVVLTKDGRVAGGLAVKPLDAGNATAVLPPTNPGMPMYMDSPGFNVARRGKTLRVPVPLYRLNNRIDFRFDAVAAYMQVAQSGDRPLLGVYKVYSILSKNLSLPYKVK
jgi:hypothetical protein